MSTYRFVVLGHPVPAQRMTQASKWTPRARRSLDYQEQVAYAAKAAGVPVLHGPVKLWVRFYVRGRNHGDVDNLCKSIADGLQFAGILPNDRQVRYLDAGVIYQRGAEERAEVELTEIAEEVVHSG